MSLLSRALLSAACILMMKLSDVNTQEDLSLVSDTFRRKGNTFFRIADMNKDGLVTEEDLHQLIRDLAKLAQLNKTYEKYLHDVKAPQLWQAFTGRPTNTSGEYLTLTREAALRSMIMNRNNREPQITAAANVKFEILDFDRTDVVSQTEHGVASKALGLGVGQTLLSFRSLDVNGDGVVCREEFVSRFVSFHTLDCIDCPSKYIYGPLV